MKKLTTLFFLTFSMTASYGQSVLLGGFDGNQTEAAGPPKTLTDAVQDTSAVGNVSVSLSTADSITGFDWAFGFQSSNATWGESTFTPAASTANNNAVYAADGHSTISMLVSNTGTSAIALDKFHIRVKRDGANSPTGIRFAYASGDLSDTPGGNTLLDVSSAGVVGFDLAFSSVVTDLTLAAGETATFTWVTEGGSGQRFRVDNIAVSGAVVSSGPDEAAPTPSPMTWASGGAPAAASDNSITMTATTASDPSGVEYQFTRYAADGTTQLSTSPWQDSHIYTDTGLASETTYSYTVTARDKAATPNVGSPSTPAASATTDAVDNAAPTPDPMTWASGGAPAAVNDSSITMTATTASDPSDVEYYFTNVTVTDGSHDSGWQDSPSYADTGLASETTYSYTVTARDKSAGQYTTDPSTPAAPATTGATPVGPILLGGFDGTNAVDSPKQDASAIGNISFDVSYTGTVVNNKFNPGALFNGGDLWGTSDFVTNADNSNNNCVLVADVHPVTLTFVVTNTSANQEITLDAIHWIAKRDRTTAPDQVTVSYTAGDLKDAPGVSAEQPMLTLTAGYDFALSNILGDRILYPGESATFTWTTKDMDDRFRVDNIAFSGTVKASDYITWSSAQGWTAGDPGTGGDDDYDLDGLSNDEERLLGLDPVNPSYQSPITTPVEAAGTFSYTRRTQSLTGQDYTIWYSTDLQEWIRDIAATQTPGTPANDIETVAVQINPVLLDEPRLFIRVGADAPLVLSAPEMVNVVGNNSTVTLNFNQELYGLAATDSANYTVELDGGSATTVTAASLSEDKKSVTLTLSSSLGDTSTYNVSFSNLTGVTGVATTGSSTGQFKTWDDDPNGIKVFILAGQSNMVGYGHAETGNGGDGARGSLRFLAVNNDEPEYSYYDYTSLLETPGDPANSAWATRGNVKVWGQNGTSANLGGNILKGDLGPFYGATNATAPDTWFGPEYAFGQVIGDFYASEDVLIIKTAWGGHSLHGNFRPPSAVADRGGVIGASYLEMIKNAREVLDNLGTEFPGWAAGKGYQIVGFGWHQGVSDSTEPFATEYRENLPDLISDVRDEVGKPNLPFVIATTGMLAAGAPVESSPYTGYGNVEKAQLWVAGVDQPGYVLTSDTRSFWRDASVSPRSQGYHWNQNAESYFLIGKKMGDNMVKLLTP